MLEPCTVIFSCGELGASPNLLQLFKNLLLKLLCPTFTPIKLVHLRKMDDTIICCQTPNGDSYAFLAFHHWEFCAFYNISSQAQLSNFIVVEYHIFGL